MKDQRDLLIRLFEEDAFTILLLDACRYDEFRRYREKRGLVGTLKKVDSHCGWTMQWIKRNWDLLSQMEVYTAHPRYKDMGYEEVNSVWSNERNEDEFMQSKLKNLSMPEEVMEEALKEDSLRSLLHFIQPHSPFVGPKGSEVDVPDVFKRLACRGKFYTLVGKIQGWERIKELYRDNLESVMSSIEKRAEEFRKPLIITADHGEMIGEKDRFGHNYLHDVTRTVPWFRWEI